MLKYFDDDDDNNLFQMLTLHNAVSNSRPPEIPLDEVCARSSPSSLQSSFSWPSSSWSSSSLSIALCSPGYLAISPLTSSPTSSSSSSMMALSNSISCIMIVMAFRHIPTMTKTHHGGILSVMKLVGICRWQNPTIDNDDIEIGLEGKMVNLDFEISSNCPKIMLNQRLF